ncbi:mechanosensitive ion channel protein MscS [Acidihalobacter aeolianus]|uniref:Small-conductance mechanosensitive channel n=1 Tax=Acidihalobacter aeolianus TaxID=2792603 RepID=A0A1D8K505_9GAMM|nr:mechanosensitive ion channel domain-containing protein [Acidihalobacter aeolianus]AOV16041.1 mechanosensitive ion channel protein MscS [Acidihalobacter aeolianus]
MNQLLDPGKFDWNHLLEAYAIPWGIKIVFALAVLAIGLWLAGLLTKLIGKALVKARMDTMLVRFLESIIKALLQMVVVIAALSQLGVQTTSLIAILGAAGLAIGLALQNSLSNFAAGVLLLVFKPFKSGDFVEAGGVLGVVEHVRVFNSVLRTPDNREITVPNGKIYNDVITNYSARDTRRIDLVVGISYDADIRKAKEIVEAILAEDARILKDPAATCGVMDLADSSVNLYIRPWVASADYWNTRCDLLETIKLRFDANGIGIPYPQMDVHLQHGKSEAA